VWHVTLVGENGMLLRVCGPKPVALTNLQRDILQRRTHATPWPASQTTSLENYLYFRWLLQ
jgi:hypothetical protein